MIVAMKKFDDDISGLQYMGTGFYILNGIPKTG